MTSIDMTLGEKIKELRKARGLSQEELAEQINVSRQAVSKWELDLSLPDIDNIGNAHSMGATDFHDRAWTHCK